MWTPTTSERSLCILLVLLTRSFLNNKTEEPAGVEDDDESDDGGDFGGSVDHGLFGKLCVVYGDMMSGAPTGVCFQK